MSEVTMSSYFDPDDEIVITGMAGRYPKCNSINELRERLLNKQDLITDNEDLFNNTMGIQTRFGVISDKDKFDHLFFTYCANQVQQTDPSIRILLEKAYEALIDAGFTADDFQNKNVGVFSVSSFGDTEMLHTYSTVRTSASLLSGIAKSMLANRISYSFNFTGPSIMLGCGYATGLLALDEACRAIRRGACEAAIVAGVSLCLTPHITLQHKFLGLCSEDGVPRPYDDNANGIVRSEAVSVLVLQKRKYAKRVYATIVHSKTAFVPEYSTGTGPKSHAAVLKSFYDECGVDPATVSFVEGGGCGLKMNDMNEVEALDEVYCANKKSPLFLGSIQSNMGATDACSTLCSVVKALLCFETGELIPNINYSKPCRESDALTKGRIQVLTERRSLEGDLIAINSFNHTGTFCHVLLKRHNKPKGANVSPLPLSVPRLLVLSGRTKEGVNDALEEMMKLPVDDEFISLVNGSHAVKGPHHLYRGHCLHTQGEKSAVNTMSCSGTRPPLWLICSGMGSQWSTMGSSLMQVPPFARAIHQCDLVLKPKGVDIYNVITSEDPKVFDNVLNSFVGIVAFQLGLIDTLEAIGIEADGFIGHSLGEVSCAYIDKTLNSEQTILAAYYRGLASLDKRIARGAMTAVGLGYNGIKDICPPDIDIACHNSKTSCTISGPEEAVRDFTRCLKAKGVFAKEVQCGHIAYHSRYITNMGSALLHCMEEVIPQPKPRSSKWISSSVPQDQWDSYHCKMSSAQYQVNNMLNPVLFEEACHHIPNDAIAVEVAPHGLLQAILKRSLHPSIKNVALANRGMDGLKVLLTALGILYNDGFDMDLRKLYPPIEYPVGRGTPSTASVVRWDHSEVWAVATDIYNDHSFHKGVHVIINPKEEGSEFYLDHMIGGCNVLPASTFLVLAWKAAVDQKYNVSKRSFQDTSVSFECLHFHRQLRIYNKDDVQLEIILQNDTGNFEILESELPVLSGRIKLLSEDSQEVLIPHVQKDTCDKNVVTLKREDIYKYFVLRGHNYMGEFCSLISATSKGDMALLSWNENWVTFLDGMYQCKLLSDNIKAPQYPQSILRLVINSQKHKHDLSEATTRRQKALPLYIDNNTSMIHCGGVLIQYLIFNPIISCKLHAKVALQQQQFVPYCNPKMTSLNPRNVMEMCIKLVAENRPKDGAKFIQIKENSGCSMLDSDIMALLQHIQVNILTRNMSQLTADIQCHMIAGVSLLQSNILTTVVRALSPGGSIITKEKPPVNMYIIDKHELQVILDQQTGDNQFLVLRKPAKLADLVMINISSSDNSWLPQLHCALKSMRPPKRLLLVCQKEPLSGLVRLYRYLRSLPGNEMLRYFFIVDPKAPRFDPGLSLYHTQLNKDLQMNVLSGGQWGSYWHFDIPTHVNKSPSHYYGTCTKQGNLDSITWIEGPLTSDIFKHPAGGQQLVQVHWAALNFQDIMLAFGRIHPCSIGSEDETQECLQGIEFSGMTSRGSRVMGMVPGRGISNIVEVDSQLLWEVPEQWTLEEAATVPVAYCTALYAINILGNCISGDSILIHCGCGAVGQAAIRVALHKGLTVFTTVGTQEKRDFIRKHYPEIPDTHIGYSRDTSFMKMVMLLTEGEGVTFVLNSLTGDKFTASTKCLESNGHFVELGVFDQEQNNPLGLSMFLKETSFKSLMMRSFFNAKAEDKEALHKLLKTAIKDGTVQPLYHTTFHASQLQQAYRHMSNGHHIGKVLIQLNSIDTFLQVQHRWYCHPQHTYVVAGDMEGFGIMLAHWLVSRGACRLLLATQHNMDTGFHRQCIYTWEKQGIQVMTCTADMSVTGINKIIASCKHSASISSIFYIPTQDQSHTLSATIHHLDKNCYKSCPILSTIIVLTDVDTDEQQAMINGNIERVCESYSSERLVARVINMHIGDNKKMFVNFQALDVLLKHHCPVVSCNYLSDLKTDPLEKAAQLIGVKDFKTMSWSSEVILRDIGLDSLTIEAFRLLLQEELSLFLTPKMIHELPISKLQRLMESTTFKLWGYTEIQEYLHQLMPEIPPQLESYPAVVRLPSASTIGPPLFAVPGLVSMTHTFGHLAEHLTCPVYGMQFGTSSKGTSIQEMAKFLFYCMMNHVSVNEPFTLLGHSLGGLLVLEMAAMLEEVGWQGHVVLLDSSPEVMRVLCGGDIKKLEKIHKWLMFHMLILIGVDNKRILEDLDKSLQNEPWYMKVQEMLNRRPSTCEHSKYYLKELADTCSIMLKAGITYTWKHTCKLNSPVLFLQPAIPSLVNIDDSQVMSAYCQQLEVQVTYGSHATMVKNPETAAIINRFLCK